MAPGNSTDVQLAAGGNATVGSVEARMGWAPFNHHRDGKALLGQLDLAFLGAYACELRQLFAIWSLVVALPMRGLAGPAGWRAGLGTPSTSNWKLLSSALLPPAALLQSACLSAVTWGTGWTCATSSQVRAAGDC